MTLPGPARARCALLMLVALVPGAPAPRARAAIDPLPSMLSDDWDEARRRDVRDHVRALGDAACATLSGYAAAPDARAREHAVRALADAGCSSVADYRGFFADASAWVADAVIDAVLRLRIAAAAPFLLAHLDDRRRLVSDDGEWVVADAAERALRRLTAQPIPRRPAPGGRTEGGDAAAWRAWFDAHGGDGPARWLASGLDAIRADLAGNDAARRRIALDTLALVGGPGREALAEALKRSPGDLDVGLVCLPDEAPRVLDRIPCTLTITNVGTRRLDLALGDVVVRLDPEAAPAASAPSAAPAPSHGKAGAARERPGAPPARERTGGGETADPPDDAALARLAGTFVDLAPGEAMHRPVEVGPVKTAGHYQIHAGLQDLARPLLSMKPGGAPGAIETVAAIRFEP